MIVSPVSGRLEYSPARGIRARIGATVYIVGKARSPACAARRPARRPMGGPGMRWPTSGCLAADRARRAALGVLLVAYANIGQFTTTHKREAPRRARCCF